jgi:hypothetical protein
MLLVLAVAVVIIKLLQIYSGYSSSVYILKIMKMGKKSPHKQIASMKIIRNSIPSPSPSPGHYAEKALLFIVRIKV